MAPEHFLQRIIDPGLTLLETLKGPAVTRDARRMMLAIALQESGPGLVARYQNSPNVTPGPARGFWQFELGGGVAGVLSHRASGGLALDLCDALAVLPEPAAVWRALEGHDVLACGFARLLLWTLPSALPGSAEEGWRQYMAAWRPGKPHQERWQTNWDIADTEARDALQGFSS